MQCSQCLEVTCAPAHLCSIDSGQGCHVIHRTLAVPREDMHTAEGGGVQSEGQEAIIRRF